MRLPLILLLSLAAGAQNTTPNLGLTLPAPNQIGWSNIINQNFSIIDGFFGTSQGATGFPALTITNPGVFTNTQMNEYLKSIINNCNPTTEFGAAQAGNFATEGVTGCVTMPATIGVHQVNAMAGYASSLFATASSGGAVGGYFQGRQLASNGSIWGANTLVQDVGGLTNTQMASIEADVNFFGSPARVWGILITGASSGTAPATGIGNAAGIDIRAPGFAGTGLPQWNGGVVVEQATTSEAAFFAGPNASTNNANSQTIELVSRTSGGVVNHDFIKALADGNINSSAPVQQLKLADQGTCTMSSGACSAQSLSTTYTAAPVCVATWTGTGTLAGAIKIASTTTTVTPSSSTGTDTAQVNWVCFGS